jgi:hypothetical protein
MDLRISDDCYITNRYTSHIHKCEMIFACTSEPLVASFTKTNILLGCTITDNYKTITFNSASVKSLTSFRNNFINNKIPMGLIHKLIYDLSTQLKYLINKYGKCFIGYSIKHVIVVDDNTFIYLPNNEDICDIEDDAITITCPFSQDDFFQSPETILVNSVPSYIHYKTVYYSLACLIMYCLKNEYSCLIKTDLIERNEELLNTLVVKDSKLYYLLKRCLTKDANKRYFIYI